jgi:hypothetical protein
LKEAKKEEMIEYIFTEIDEEVDGVEFTEKTSSASCAIEDILSMTFGGFSARFWMLRKHINSLEDSEIHQMPFYSWNCLTLGLQGREIDLVIRNEQEMQYIIKFLIYSMRTVDGKKNSGDKLLQLMDKQAIEDWKKQNMKDKLPLNIIK